MNHTQKLKINTVTSLLNRLVRIISGLILPRMILIYFGSEINGLVASLNQFLSIITFLDMGVGSVVLSALYRPLANKDKKQASLVLTAAKKYFRKIAFALIIYIIAIIIFYPLLIDSSLDYLSTVFLIIALSISLFGQYYFGIVNELLLDANQDSYVQYGSEIVVIILNVIISVFLITQGFSIQVVKLGSGMVFLIRPIFLSYYVNKKFDIQHNIEILVDPLPQKWNGMGQHLAYSIQNSSSIVLLTLFSTLESISIYNIHNIIVKSIVTLISSLTSGLKSFFGNLIALDEIYKLNIYFDKIEWIIHTGVVYLFGMTAILIDPFVRLYTSGVDDLNYYFPIFSLLLVLANAAYSIRLPYQAIITSAGHFKETQTSSFVETGLNIFFSLYLINQIGLIGIPIGMLISVLYRIVYLVIYLSKNIIYRPLHKFVKHAFVDTITFSLVVIIGGLVKRNFVIIMFIDWLMVAVLSGALLLIVTLIINLFFYKKLTMDLIKGIFKGKN